MDYLIWSNEHGRWWAPNSIGYTDDITAAGIYSRDDALVIVQLATLIWDNSLPPNELPVRIDDLPQSVQKLLKR